MEKDPPRGANIKEGNFHADNSRTFGPNRTGCNYQLAARAPIKCREHARDADCKIIARKIVTTGSTTCLDNESSLIATVLRCPQDKVRHEERIRKMYHETILLKERNDLLWSSSWT